MPQKKTPQRSCVACRQTADKRALLRFVRGADGQVHLDPTGRAAGRGAYLCADAACMAKASKSHLLDRALRVRLTEQDYQKLGSEHASLVSQQDSSVV
ncbi:MAG: YlxR family protein [Coriobacteriales bacterium]|jgi:predicted RNA-binding protein YlxR (DUF448 family)|nr:YlxR family protein [Coriobacteriales bacterium]